MRTQDKIIKCLREHGGEINPSRGYTAVVKLAQRMRLDHNDRAILEDVTDSLQALERDGRVVIDWANNRAHASSIMLIEENNTEPEPELKEEDDTNQPQTVEERVNALIARLREVKLDAANAEFELALAKARADEAETMALEESARADQAERDRDRQLERVSTLEARIAKLESDLEEALSQLKAQPTNSSSDEVRELKREIAQLQAKLDEAKHNKSVDDSIRRQLDEQKDFARAQANEIGVLQRENSQLKHQLRATERELQFHESGGGPCPIHG